MKISINSLNFKFKNALIVCLLYIVVGCDSFVEVDIPNNQLTGQLVFTDVSTVDAALIDIYAKMRENGLFSGTLNGLGCNMGLYADELDYYGLGSFGNLAFYSNELLPSNETVLAYWNQAYNLAYEANAIIEGLEDAPNIDINDREKLIGEALFVRSFIHFYLTNLFGNIPYVNSTDYEVNRNVEKVSSETIYEFIVNDLEQAISYLPSSYGNMSRARPNGLTAMSLLARTYLYQKSWDEAEAISTQIIESQELVLQNDLSVVFLNNSKETIWQLPPSMEGLGTKEAGTFILLAAPPQNVALTLDLIDSFEETDLRMDHWITSIAGNGNTFYFPYKYKQRDPASVSSEYSIVFRLSEIYLIRAESRLMKGNLDGALNDLNTIRNRAGLSNATMGLQDELSDLILQERSHELFTEFGHRFFDLKRTNNANQVLVQKKPGWDSEDIRLPIPQSEIAVNPNLLPQNPGY